MCKCEGSPSHNTNMFVKITISSLPCYIASVHPYVIENVASKRRLRKEVISFPKQKTWISACLMKIFQVYY